jgi:peptidoglycan/xylan/chitin deacetylase (PgdA/CDA1 family)
MTLVEKAAEEGWDGNAGEAGNAKPCRSKSHMIFRKSVRWMVASIMTYSGAVFLRNLFGGKPRARILVYHSISDDPLNPFSVSPADFEEQVRYLAREYNVISLEELVACIRDDEGEIPPDSVVLTFDDGFRDNYVRAYPILKRYGVPATIFVIVERLESDRDVLSQSGVQRPGLYLSWGEVLEMSEDGISIGSHTLTHPWLIKVTLEQARREINESRACLEQHLRKPVHLFAYPGGRLCDFGQDITKIVVESGYSGACVGFNGTNSVDTDPYLLKRTKIEVGDGLGVFKKAMRGALDIFVLLDQMRRYSV